MQFKKSDDFGKNQYWCNVCKNLIMKIHEYFGLDAPKKLYKKLREDTLFIAKEYLDKKIKMKDLSETQKAEFKEARKCYICERKLQDIPPSVEKEIILNKKN